MKVIYVAGPFRSDSAWGIEQNIRRAEESALELWLDGWAVICPHTNTRFFQGAAPDDVWLKGCLEILARCDAIYMIKGWANSSGSLSELAMATKLGLKVLYETSG